MAEGYKNSILKQRAELIEAELGDRAFHNEVFKEAWIMTQAVKQLSVVQSSVAQAMMEAMWKVYENGLFQFAGEYNEFSEWVAGEFDNDQYENFDELRKWANVVEHMLSWVHSNVVGDIKGERITVDKLIHTYGNAGKMRNMLGTFRSAEDRPLLDKDGNIIGVETADDIRKRIIQEVWEGTQASCNDLRLDLAKEAAIASKVTIFKVKKKINADGTYDITFAGLSEEDAADLELLLGENVEFEFDEGS